VDFYPSGLLSMNDARAALGLGPLPDATVWDELAGKHPGSWFREWQHPRDRDGQWIEKGGLVRALIGGQWKTGVARTMNRNNTVTVETQDGSVHDIHPKNIQASDAKATLHPRGAPGRIAPAPALPEAGPRKSAYEDFPEATPEQRAELGISEKNTNPVYINPNPQGETLLGYSVTTGLTGKQKRRFIYTPDHHAYQAVLKYRRAELMDQHFDKLMERLREDAKWDPTAAAVLIMAAVGMRPSSEADDGKVKTYGATTLLNRHVTVGTTSDGEKYVKFDFIGKSGKRNVLVSTDPTLVEAMQQHRLRHNRQAYEGKVDPDTPLFNTNPDKTSDYIRENTTGLKGKVGVDVEGNLKNKDLRTYQANMLAVEMKAAVEAAFPGGPKNAEEFMEMRKMLGELVSGKLGNTPAVALNSYINPNVMESWAGRLGPEEYDRVMEELWSIHSQT
jgi:DNA topoisomerase IB